MKHVELHQSTGNALQMSSEFWNLQQQDFPILKGCKIRKPHMGHHYSNHTKNAYHYFVGNHFIPCRTQSKMLILLFIFHWSIKSDVSAASKKFRLSILLLKAQN